MYQIKFYKNKDGDQPALDYIRALRSAKGKQARIEFEKIVDYLQALSEFGLMLGMPYIRHIEGTIWELRPHRRRFFFVVWDGDTFLILHQFQKETRKTPKKEIDKAKRELEDAVYREDAK